MTALDIKKPISYLQSADGKIRWPGLVARIYPRGTQPSELFAGYVSRHGIALIIWAAVRGALCPPDSSDTGRPTRAVALFTFSIPAVVIGRPGVVIL